jgi:uncharacterized protein
VRVLETPVPATGGSGVAPERVRLVTIGLVGGVTSGLLGVGGGVVMIPLMVLWLSMGQRLAHAISLAAIIPISAAAAISYYLDGGHIELLPAAALALGGICGARVGAGLLARIPERPLKAMFGGFILIAAVLIALKV